MSQPAPQHDSLRVPCRTLCGRRRHGVMLIMVMVVIVMLTLAGLSFVMTMSTEHEAAVMHGKQLRLAGLTESGEEMLRAFFDQPASARQAAGGGSDNPALFQGILVFEEELAGLHGRVSIVAPSMENGQTTMRFGAINESARLNLAVLPYWDKNEPGAGRDALMGLPGMTGSTADAILDWIDPDDAPRASGAEAEYYASLSAPYAPRNGTPASLEELLLVRGVTRGLLLGPDTNFNHRLSANETRMAETRSGRSPTVGQTAWANLLTVYSAERNTSTDGSPRIDLNTDDLESLFGQLTDVFDPQWAEFIVLYRQFGPDEVDEAELASPSLNVIRPKPVAMPTMRPAVARQPKRPITAVKGTKTALVAKTPRDTTSAPAAAHFDLTLPAKFKIDSPLDLIGVYLRIPGSDEESDTVVESPFAADNAAMQQYLPLLMDRTTAIAAKVIPGRINVSLAPRPVLLGVPGMDRTLAERILAMRRSSGQFGGTDRQHASWLLTRGLVDLAQMKALLPYLTGGGDVFRAQVVGYFDEGGPRDRVELVVDATTRPPRQVYWKSLTLFGHGYALESLGAQPSDW